MSTDKSRRLGKGLDALLAGRPMGAEPARARDEVPRSALRSVPISQIKPNPLQPRKEFGASDLKELESSIRANGLLQPVTVRAANNGSDFYLIAGERRFRAVQRLGWREIPAIVREEAEVDDKALLTLALVENLQRTDLNPIEEGEGYQQLISQFSLSQQEVADVVGKDRSTVANTLRLLALPSQVRRMVREGELTIGHARALLSLGDLMALARLRERRGMTVIYAGGGCLVAGESCEGLPETGRPPMAGVGSRTALWSGTFIA